MSDLRTMPREFLMEFIQLYRSNPCLWKIKSKEYTDKNKKNVAYEQLRIKLSEIDSEATKEAVIKKINSLQSCFRKELKKVKESQKSGNGTDDNYIPSLWYYEDLLFLLEQELPRQSVSSLDSPKEVDDDGVDETASVSNSVVSLSGECSTRQSFRKKMKLDRSDEVLNLVATKLQSSEGKFSAYGKHLAQELESLPDEMAVFCRKVINDALFEAQMGTLNRTSRVVTDPPYPPSISTPQEYVCPEPSSHTTNPNVSVGQLFANFLQ